MNIDQAFPSNYLKAADLNGRTKTLIVDKVVLEDVGGEGKPGDHKPVLHFTGEGKPVVLNKTNATTIRTALGPQTEAWVGKKIEVFPSTTSFQGRMVDCIRVRMPEFDDDVPEFAAPAGA